MLKFSACCLVAFLVVAYLSSCRCGRADPQMDGAIDATVARLKSHIDARLASRGSDYSAEDEMWVAAAYKSIGLMLQSKGIRQHLGGDRLQREALENYNLALSLDKGRTISLNVQIYYLKGMLLKMMGLGSESIESLDQLDDFVLSDHDKASVDFQRADTLQMMGRTVEANTFFKSSLQLRPCRTERFYQYVNSCKDLGTFSKQDWLEILDYIQAKLKECEAKRNGPNKTEQPTITGIDTDAEDEDDAEESDVAGNLVPTEKSAALSTSAGKEIESYLLFDDNDSPEGISGTNSAVYWALYIAAEKAGRYALAWWYLEYANNLEKSIRAVKFDRSEVSTQTIQILSAFTTDLLDSLAYMKGKASKVPIFIVGFMRSGSTLLETMLDSHSKIWGMGEDSFFNANLTDFRNKLVSPSNPQDSPMQRHQHLQNTLSQYGKAVVREMRALAAERDLPSNQPTDDASTSNALQSDADRSGGADGSAGSVVGADDKKVVATNKKKKGKAKKNKVTHIVDKMLFNYRNIGFLHMVFPDALILHTIRDPLDTLFSCFRCKFDDAGLEWSLDTSDLVLQYAKYLEIMQHFRTVLPGRVIDIRYEDLVRDPESIMRTLIVDKLHLDWEPGVLEFHKNNRSVQTHSQSQVKQKLYTHSVGSWTRYKHQLEPMSAELRKFLPQLKKAHALPFYGKMNWELDPDFDYAIELVNP